jgi:2-ketoarginine methyltransferase
MDALSVDAGNAAARSLGLSDRVLIRFGRTATETPDLGDQVGPFCFLTAFVLQEILEQAGRSAVIQLLTSTFRRHPGASWIVIEVDHRPRDPGVMSHPLGLGYYNPYYLIHALTEQRLETLDFWYSLFSEAGLAVAAVERPDPSIDSLGLKVGFLLTLESG